MFENFIIVPVKKPLWKKALAGFLLALMLFCLLMGTLITPYIFEIPAILFGIGWYILTFKSYIEYEYSYFDGDLKITKIKNKNRRKRQMEISMDKVIIMAPKGSSSVAHYENNPEVIVKDFSSKEADASIYEMILSVEDGTMRIEFEPDEKMIDAMRVKYSRIVMK